MRPIARHVQQCRVCGADDWAEVISFGPMSLVNGFLEPADGCPDERAYPVDVVVCQQCWLMSLRHVVDPVSSLSDYAYVSPPTNVDGHLREVLDFCSERAALARGDLVVEFGSNIGLQLEVFKQAGMRVVGVDPAKRIAEEATARGIETNPDFFGPAVASRITYDHGFAKLVLGRQCFAHIDDVHTVLDGVDAVLASDGVVVIEVPYLLDLLDGNQFDTMIHEHASYFSVQTLDRLVALHDFRLVDVRRVAVHGGSILVCAARAGAEMAPLPPVADLVALERERGLDDSKVYRGFADRLRSRIAEFRSTTLKSS